MKEEFMGRIRQFTDCASVDMDMLFKKDLFFDSLTFTKLIIDLEDFFGVEFDDDTYIVDDDIKLMDLFNILTTKMGVYND